MTLTMAFGVCILLSLVASRSVFAGALSLSVYLFLVAFWRGEDVPRDANPRTVFPTPRARLCNGVWWVGGGLKAGWRRG